jgi:predicted transcriptional regulator of viral defense system
VGQQLDTLDRAAATLAAGQHGRVAYWQLRDLGFSRKAIAYRERMGRLHRVHRGVYAVGHPGSSRQGDEIAAVLACGRGAVLSHRSAAGRWGLLRVTSGPIDVTVPGRSSRRNGILPHTARVHQHDRTRRDGIPITSVLRTLLDLAVIVSDRELARAVNEAERVGWLNRRPLAEFLERNAGRNGVRRLRALTAGLHEAAWRTRSDLEAAFLALCRKYGVPAPMVNVRVEGFEVDMYWPKARLIVELDGFEYHRTTAEFDRDRRRDAHLAARGYRVVRVTYRWLATDPAGVAATLRTLVS